MESVERRARVHAALGEPARLAIVDRLVAGDASPGELGAAIGLAHEPAGASSAGAAGRRGRSAGCSPRVTGDAPTCSCAWTTRWCAATVGRRAGRAGRGRRVVFVCTAQLGALATGGRGLGAGQPGSGGVGGHPSGAAGAPEGGRRRPPARAAAGPGPAPRTWTTWSASGDLVVAVCDQAHEELDPELPRLHWSIPDPVRVGTDAAFDAAYDEITRRIDVLARSPTTATDRIDR